LENLNSETSGPQWEHFAKNDIPAGLRVKHEQYLQRSLQNLIDTPALLAKQTPAWVTEHGATRKELRNNWKAAVRARFGLVGTHIAKALSERIPIGKLPLDIIFRIETPRAYFLKRRRDDGKWVNVPTLSCCPVCGFENVLLMRIPLEKFKVSLLANLQAAVLGRCMHHVPVADDFWQVVENYRSILDEEQEAESVTIQSTVL
jgi:hypothetical protein